jgi:methionine biosynthesis protein MetW
MNAILETARPADTSNPRLDLAIIAEMVASGSRVLDVGCGDGALLELLGRERNVDGRGVELSRRGVNECVAKGLSVIQGDADTDLADYPDDSFDYVILSQTLQAVRHTEQILMEMLRVGREVIVTFPNFGHWQGRLQLAFGGHMPVSESLPYQWYDTPNIHLFTIRDFERLCAERGIRVLERVVLADGEPVAFMPNLRGSLAVYRLQQR